MPEPKETKKNGILNYFQESYAELKKVTWPTRNQAVRLTFIVIVFCIIFSIVLGALDLAFNTGYRSLVTLSEKITPPTTTTTTPVATGEPTSKVDLSKIKIQPSATTSANTQQTGSAKTGSTPSSKTTSSTQQK